MQNNFKPKRIALLLSVILLLAITVGSTFALLVTKTPTFLNTFLSGVKIGDLTISKELVHPFGQSYALPEGLEYEFEVDLGTDYAESSVKTSQGETAVVDGKLNLTLAPGGEVTLFGLDEGSVVTVTETLPNSGYAAQKPQQVTIAANEVVTAHFKNEYTPAAVSPVDFTVSGVKELEGRDWLAEDEFSFRLEWLVGEDWVELGTQSVTYENHQFDFTGTVQALTFDQAGTYKFRISEIDPDMSGVTYDPVVSHFDVLVGDADMDGSLEIQRVMGYENAVVTGHAVSVTFKNTYAPLGSAAVTINIKKALEDLSGQDMQPAGFTFELYDQSGALVKTSETTSASGETSIKLVYDAAEIGTYTYVLKETNAGQVGMTYDDTEYKICVSVIDCLDGTVRAVIYPAADTIPDNAADTYAAQFRNTYAPANVSEVINGEKILSGRELVPGEFTFQLYETDERFDIADAQPLDTAVNEAEGAFTFKELTFDQIGTHYYVITEDDTTALGGIWYDDAQYRITIKITDENGVLTKETVIADSDGNASEIQFTNEYHPEKATVPLCGQKTLDGATLVDDEFAFLLFEADQAFTPQGEALQRVTNEATGEIFFEDLSFDEEGIFYFVIREDNSEPDERVTYDKSIYGLTVTVTDDKMGALKAEQTLTKVGEGPVDTILFENTYTSRPDDVQVPIGIKKIVKNIGPESIGPENFAFVLQNLDTGDALEVSTDSSGFAEFLLNFKEEDVGNTFHYQITERNDGRENVTYSTEVFQFAITVELGADNQLLVTKIVDDEVVEDVIALYENIYNSESATPVEPPKTGDDRPVALYLALAGVSGMMLLALLAKRRRKNS